MARQKNWMEELFSEVCKSIFPEQFLILVNPLLYILSRWAKRKAQEGILLWRLKQETQGCQQ